MLRCSVIVLAAVALGACSSDGSSGSEAAAHQQATAYRCPGASAVQAAFGHSVATPKKSYTGSRTVLCAYGGPTTTGSAIVGITFGAQASDYAGALRVLHSPKTNPVAGLGDMAATFDDDGVKQLIAVGSTRLVTVTSDPGDVTSETAIARLFL